MTFQDFLAASQGDERLAMARWIASTVSQSQSPQMWATVPSDILEGVAFPSLFILVDAVLALMEETRREDEARIEDLECQIEADSVYRRI